MLINTVGLLSLLDLGKRGQRGQRRYNQRATIQLAAEILRRFVTT